MTGSRRWFLRGLAAAPFVAPAVAWGKFTAPNAKARAAAVGPLDGLAEEWRPAFTEGPDDAPMPAPGRGDWLAQHREPPQSFAKFKKDRYHVPTAERGKIAVQPLGALAESTPLAAILDFGERWFGMPVVQREPLEIGKLGAQSRGQGRHRQYHTRGLLNSLRRRVPEDVYCLIAVTQVDLYPDPTWYFVFGEARLYDRVGVYSFARYDPTFYGETPTADTPTQVLRRSLKLMAHEVGHMFGMLHCVHFHCVMNGTNNLPETDRSPLQLCPVCLRKLQDSVGFNVAVREHRLAEFYAQHGLEAEAAVASRRLARMFAAAG